MVFERFTERAIKAVMAAQNEARSMGRAEVTTDELLLGLIVEDSASRTSTPPRSGGFMNTGITIQRAREVIKTLRGSGNLGKGVADIPFSVNAKEIFDVQASGIASPPSWPEDMLHRAALSALVRRSLSLFKMARLSVLVTTD